MASAIAPNTFIAAGVATSLVLFFAGIGLFFWAYAVAVNRSRTDLIGMGGLFFLAGTAPRSVQRSLLGSLAVEVVVGLVTAAVHPFTPLAFGVLAWMYGLALCGLWAARYGTFPPRPPEEKRRRGPRQGRLPAPSHRASPPAPGRPGPRRPGAPRPSRPGPSRRAAPRHRPGAARRSPPGAPARVVRYRRRPWPSRQESRRPSRHPSTSATAPWWTSSAIRNGRATSSRPRSSRPTTRVGPPWSSSGPQPWAEAPPTGSSTTTRGLPTGWPGSCSAATSSASSTAPTGWGRRPAGRARPTWSTSCRSTSSCPSPGS